MRRRFVGVTYPLGIKVIQPFRVGRLDKVAILGANQPTNDESQAKPPHEQY